MIRTKRRWRLCIGLLCVNLAFIWGNSLLSASASRAFSEWVFRLLTGGAPDLSQPGTLSGSGLLRKIAHFSEFCSLGMLLGWLFSMGRKHMGLAFLPGLGAALIDEGLQFLAPGRGPGLRDVCIDASGVAAGILLLLFGHDFIRKTKNKYSGGKRI